MRVQMQNWSDTPNAHQPDDSHTSYNELTEIKFGFSSLLLLLLFVIIITTTMTTEIIICMSY